MSELVTSIFKLHADTLGVQVLASEQSWSIDGGVSAGAAAVAGLEPCGLLGGGRGVLEGRLELTALVGAGSSGSNVVSPGLGSPISGGESDADSSLLILRDEDGSKGGFVLSRL